jgi:hypothetical protein
MTSRRQEHHRSAARTICQHIALSLSLARARVRAVVVIQESPSGPAKDGPEFQQTTVATSILCTDRRFLFCPHRVPTQRRGFCGGLESHHTPQGPVEAGGRVPSARFGPQQGAAGTAPIQQTLAKRRSAQLGRARHLPHEKRKEYHGDEGSRARQGQQAARKRPASGLSRPVKHAWQREES